LAALEAGATLPTAALPALGGGELTIPGSGPLTLVFVFKESCVTCRLALPFVQVLHEEAAADLTIRAIIQDDESTASRLAVELGLTFPIAIETEPWPVSESYGLLTVPTSFLVDESGEIELTSVGFSGDDLLQIAGRASAQTESRLAKLFPPDVPVFRPG